jgi:ketosteroid isomerase-like protein
MRRAFVLAAVSVTLSLILGAGAHAQKTQKAPPPPTPPPPPAAPAPPPPPVLKSPHLPADFAGLVAAERAFAKLAAEKGIKESFLAAIDKNGVLFRPGPVTGKVWLNTHPAPAARLVWRPAHAEIARSGDLGWTTGPYEITPQGQPKSYGQFSTVWLKQADGTWKFLADLGVETPAPAPEGKPKLVSPSFDPGKEVDVMAVRESLLAADRDLATAAAKGVAAAYVNAATDATYLLRDGRQPGVGKAAIRTALAGDPGGLTWESNGVGISVAGDLGYTYGMAARKRPEETGPYLRVWQRQPGGGWKLSLDVMKLAGK